jgi:hypothetical protein
LNAGRTFCSKIERKYSTLPEAERRKNRITLTLRWSWDRKKLRSAWLHQGAYLLRTNLTDHDPEKLWRHYI